MTTVQTMFAGDLVPDSKVPGSIPGLGNLPE